MKIKMKVFNGIGDFYFFKLIFEPENLKSEKLSASVNLGTVKIIQIKKKQCIGLGSFFNRITAPFFCLDIPLSEEAILERYINIKDLKKQLERSKIKKIRHLSYIKELVDGLE